ncbi:MAG: hypothetical protein JW965_00565 [Bacteroidales bacterium]|nr:hypothetical protein [Bacteroidales bacterium]
MIRFIVILLPLLFSQLFPKTQFRYYDRGKPTPEGIERFILQNEHRLAQEYMNFVQDTLYYYHIWADELPVYNENEYGTFELGKYYFPGDIIISNENKYIDYAVDSLSFIKRNLVISNKFVKGCVFHELTHIWIQQILSEMEHEVSPEHRNFRIYYSLARDYGADFIEEGICEYIAHKAGEILYPKKYAPDLDNKWDTYEIKYQYAEYYVRQILDRYDNIKEGIKTILRTPPPSKEEIIKPEMYYQRIFSEGL